MRSVEFDRENEKSRRFRILDADGAWSVWTASAAHAHVRAAIESTLQLGFIDAEMPSFDPADGAVDSPMEVAVLGGFSVGKSSLINALLNREVLPTGVQPVTACVTILKYSSEEWAEVEHRDGARARMSVSEAGAAHEGGGNGSSHARDSDGHVSPQCGDLAPLDAYRHAGVRQRFRLAREGDGRGHTSFGCGALDLLGD